MSIKLKKSILRKQPKQSHHDDGSQAPTDLQAELVLRVPEETVTIGPKEKMKRSQGGSH